jgi:hypothetical protein
MAYYDLASKKWSTVTTLSMAIDDYTFTFDGFSTMIFGSVLPLANPLVQYGANTQGLIQSILTLVLDENEPSKARFVSHLVTPFAGVNGVFPHWDAPIAYDPLRSRIYMAVSLQVVRHDCRVLTCVYRVDTIFRTMTRFPICLRLICILKMPHKERPASFVDPAKPSMGLVQ